jgi:alanine racemase
MFNYKTISLSNFESNIKLINGILDKSKIMLVVKANAYGHDMKIIVKKAIAIGVDYFLVYNFKEALEVRKISQNSKILVLGYTANLYLSILVRFNIHITISSTEQLDFIKKNNIPIKFHLKFETGLNRYGINFDKKTKLTLKQTKDYINLNLAGIYSHFSSADSNLKYSLKQYKSFLKIIQYFKENNLKTGVVHLANSSGLLISKKYHFDYCRVGLLAYGYNPSKFHQIQVLPVMKLSSYISSIKWVEKNQPVGYGNTYITNKRTLVAIVSIGYADGIKRILSNSLSVLINEKPFNCIGRISMDSFMINITNSNNLKLGDEVIILSNNDPDLMLEMCYKANTIPYEILTTFGSRIKVKCLK